MADCSDDVVERGPLAVKTRTCKFFQTQKGCRFGDDCRFVHIKKLPDESIVSFREADEQVNLKSRTGENEPLVGEKEAEKLGDCSKSIQGIVCKFFQRKRGCLRGDNCPFEHVISNHVHDKKRTPHQRKKTARTATNDKQITRVDVVDLELENCVDKPSGEGGEANMTSYVASRNVAESEETGHGKRVTRHKKYNRTKDTAAGKGELTNAEGKDKNVVKLVRARGQTLPTEKNNVSYSKEVLAGNPFHQQNSLMQGTDAGIGGRLTEKNNYDVRHTASAKGIPIPTQGTVKQREGVPIPKMEVTTKGTEYQKKDLIPDKKNIARHQEEDKENASAVRGTYTLADAIFAERKRLRSTEIQQLKRRFGDKGGYCEIKENSCFKIKVKPTDPDWMESKTKRSKLFTSEDSIKVGEMFEQFQIEAVYLTVSFPADYPLHIFSVSLSEEQDLPQDIISFVTQRIQQWTLQQEQTGESQASLKLYFRPFLRWFDKNLVSFFVDAGKEMRKTFVSSIIDLDNTACEIHPTDELKLVAHDAVNGSQPNTQHGEDNDFGSWQLHDTIANSKSLKGSEINVVSSGDGFDCHAFMKKDSKGKEILNVQTDASCSTFEVTPHDNSTDTTDNQDTDISSINTNVICGNSSSMLDADHGKQAVDMTSSNCDQNSNTGYGAQAAQSDSCGKDNTSAKSVERGTQIQFKGLHLEESTSSLRGNKVVFTLECSRCKQRVDQQLSASGPVVKQCTRCASAFGVVFRPAIIHQFSSILGYLDLDGCVPFDVVLPESELLLGCFHCSKETTVKGLQYGGNWSWCSHCHQKLSFQVQSTRFQQLQSGVATAVALRKSTVSGILSKPKKPQSSGVKEGQPLPAKGTCKHYKKSYRWLRFPCCGKCYPCDLCHEEEEDHEMKYATRMVCGFCSREQPYSQQPCSGCKAAVTKSRSAYWEGGKGCRDKVAMSRNDDQKYRQHGKTTSRKAQKRSEGKGKGHKGK